MTSAMTAMHHLDVLKVQLACDHANARTGYDWMVCDDCGYMASKSTIGTPRENIERAILRAERARKESGQ